MGVSEADELQKLIERAKAWPVWSVAGPASNIRGGISQQVGSYGKSGRDIELWIAMREGDRDRIKALIEWPGDRDYRIDPLPGRISNAFADLLFGEEPEITPAKDGDDKNMEDLDDANGFSDLFRAGAADASSEGEIWWRIYTDPDAAERPLLEFVSRLDVVPLWRGRKLVGAAFISLIATNEVRMDREIQTQYFRHVEIQTVGYNRNLLYKGTYSTLGSNQPLKTMVETEGYPEDWYHDLPFMLAGRIPNQIGRDFRLGLSDYQGIRDLLLDLNEARSIMAENARLTAKSRMVVPLAALKDGRFDAGSDVIVHESLDVGMDDTKPGPYAVLQYTFEADNILAHINALRSAALTGVGLMEQFIGSGDGLEGNGGLSGTSLKTRLIPTTLASNGRGRFWDKIAPEILRRMQMVDGLPVNKLGFDHKWSGADESPAFNRKSVLPEDQTEKVDRHVSAVGGEIESIETAIRDLHPEWDEPEVTAEIDRIKEDRKSAAPDNPFDPNNPSSEDPVDLPGGGPKPVPSPQVDPQLPPSAPGKPAPGLPKPKVKPAPGGGGR